MIAYTMTNQTWLEMYQSLECKNLRLGNGTMEHLIIFLMTLLVMTFHLQAVV
jgi:hypothetical protein